MLLRLLFVLLLMLPIATCISQDTTKVIEFPGNAVLPDWTKEGVYPQPDIYAKWWDEASQCIGLPISMKARNGVTFKYVDSPTFTFKGFPPFIQTTNGVQPTRFIGFTMWWTNTIYMSIGYANDRRVVKHEMLHYILWQNGKASAHPFSNDAFKKCKL